MIVIFAICIVFFWRYQNSLLSLHSYSTNQKIYAMLKLKAIERKQTVGMYQGQYRYMLQPEIYSTLSDKKVIEEAASKSGVSRGILQAAWEAIGAVIQSWATEGHSVAIPGLGTMRFGVNSVSVASVNEVASNLITSRKVIFTPNVDIKAALRETKVNITCYDRDGNIVKRVTSDNSTVDEGSGEYVVELACNDALGTVTGAGKYAAGTEVQISATSKGSATFTEWSDGNTNPVRTIVVNGPISLTAKFTESGSGGSGGSGSSSGDGTVLD